MGLGSKIRTGAMVSGAVSAHNISKNSKRSAAAAEATAAWQRQQAFAQHATAHEMARAAHAAEQHARIAHQAAVQQHRMAEESASQARRAQFAQWRQTPDGRAYEQWKQQAISHSEDLLGRMQPAVGFQPSLAAAHAYDTQQAQLAYPDPAPAPQPQARIVPAPTLKPVVISVALLGLVVLWPLLRAGLNPVASEAVASLVGFALAAGICIAGARWIQQRRVAKADAARTVAQSEYEASVGRWHDWQAALATARASRTAFLNGASANPSEVPDWWEASVSNGSLLPVPEEISAYEERAMREFPSPSQLPKLERASFRILHDVPGGPEVQKALNWFRSQNVANA